MRKPALFALALALSLAAAVAIRAADTPLAITPREYKLLVEYAGSHGGLFGGADSEYTHGDSAGNRHRMIVMMRRPEKGGKLQAAQVSAWGNSAPADHRTGKPFFYYFLTADGVSHLDSCKEDRADVEKVVQELLARAKK